MNRYEVLGIKIEKLPKIYELLPHSSYLRNIGIIFAEKKTTFIKWSQC